MSAVILAGGKARRMDGADKGLQLLQNRPLFEHVLARLRPQVSEIAINANRHQTCYAKAGLPVFADELPDFQGPLSGMLTTLKRSQHDYVLFVPCDCPFLPDDLAAKLKSAVENHRTLAAYARDDERAHPTFCLLSTQLIAPLTHYLAQGERRLLLFMQQVGAVAVPFSQPNAFLNVNTLAELERYNKSFIF